MSRGMPFLVSRMMLCMYGCVHYKTPAEGVGKSWLRCDLPLVLKGLPDDTALGRVRKSINRSGPL